MSKEHSLSFTSLDKLPHGYCLFDHEFRVVYWNATLEVWSGLSSENVLGKNLLELFPNLNRDPYKTSLSRAVKNSIPTVFSSLIHKHLISCPLASGGFQKHETYVTSVDFGDEKYSLLLVENSTTTSQTVDRYRELVSDLRVAEKKALAAVQARTSFLANMSHEIRTPMNGIVGLLELMGDTNLNEIQAQYLQTLKNTSEVLIMLVNDVLDMSKIEAGEMDMDQSSVDFEELIDLAVEIFSAKASRKNIEILVRIEAGLNTHIYGDHLRLRQIITNLFSNAIKFTPDGGTISLELKQLEGNLIFEINDTGLGIAEKELESIFHSFIQATTTKIYGGTGLGLPISRSLARLMGGDIAVKSKIEEGSTFQLTLPYRVNKEEPVLAPMFQQGQDVVVLGPAGKQFEIISEMLSSWGLDVYRVEEFDEGVIKDRRSLQGMIVVSEFPTSQLHQWRTTLTRLFGDKTALVAVLDPANFSTDAGFLSPHNVRPISFPIKRKTLALALQNQKPIISKASVPEDEEDAPEANILLVDDVPLNRDIILGFLNKFPYEISTAKNGEDALKLFKENSFDLVLMDLQMPVMDGFEATKKIRSLEENSGKRTPIVAISAFALAAEKEKSLGAGCDIHLNKPVRRKELLSIIKKCLIGGIS